MFGVDPAARKPRSHEPTGFPSPAQDYFEGGIDLNRHLIRDRTSTFIMRVAGDSMAGAGIADGDEIIVDRALTPRDASVVVAIVAGELLIRRLLMHDGATSLATEPAPPLPPIAADSTDEINIWGVVTRCLHHV
ncbi:MULTISPECIES: LexA family protein [Arthrobacter]|uniref:LexA family protein n=1 Tax=unclassified Arthrobacter TaxID=235627 RepID=UPI0024BA1A27|nr:translesion error-prone DNA polymerase V autoproteolytic subunit [Arthrobacter sp. H35-MC1]MDJ0317552.1 translesion error-prone DNA polymerase V autoproteolytic subunit [Arthrobacter sp. H35-MC1]